MVLHVPLMASCSCRRSVMRGLRGLGACAFWAFVDFRFGLLGLRVVWSGLGGPWRCSVSGSGFPSFGSSQWLLALLKAM